MHVLEQVLSVTYLLSNSSTVAVLRVIQHVFALTVCVSTFRNRKSRVALSHCRFPCVLCMQSRQRKSKPDLQRKATRVTPVPSLRQVDTVETVLANELQLRKSQPPRSRCNWLLLLSRTLLHLSVRWRFMTIVRILF